MASGLKNIETIESPFRRFVTTIGLFPTAFTDAMTYYECLAYLVKYIEDTVVPALNENAEALKELQKYYVQLKSYVDNYFDNLDVQDEINNKLDEMAEAGTLQEIITAYIQSNATWTFDTVADMKQATNLVDGSFARTLGFYAVNDGGGATYHITNTGTANDIDVISVNGLYAHLVPQAKISILQCGAKKDGSADASTVINYLIDTYPTNTVFIPNGDYLISDTILLDTATKLEGENPFKTRLFTNSDIIMMENKNDDIATCYVSNLYLDGNKHATKGFYLYRKNPNLVYNDSRSLVENINVKKCTDWCFQIGDPDTGSNVIEIVVNNIYVHEYTGGGIYISKCSDSHFSNIRSGSGQMSTKPAILVEGYNLQLDKVKGFLAGNSTTPYSGIVFNYASNIVAEVEAQANNAYGVEINNTKDSIFNIVADKNCSSSSYAGILINKVQNCIVNGVVSNNVATDDFNTTTACKIIEPKKLTLNIQTDSSVTKILDLSQYNTNQISNVNADINVNGYDITDVTPTLPDSVTAPSGVTITKIGNGKYHVAGTVTSDQNVWLVGSYGQHAMLTKIYNGFTYSLSTKNKDIGMSVWNYVTNLGGGRCSKIEGATNEITAVALTLKANVTYDCIIEPQILACPNTWLTV